jgi:dihydroflavonol-4-reductase
MKVAITGASGHIGNNLTRAILAQGRRSRVLVHRSSQALEGLDVERVVGDIRDPAALDALLEGVSVVYHLAGHVSIRSKDPLVEVNLDGPRAVVDACLRHRVSRLVHFSSCQALETPPPGTRILEEAPIAEAALLHSYDRSKAEGEKLVRAAIASGLDAVICSPTGVIGPFDFAPSFTGDALIRMHEGTLPALVDGRYDFVDVRDVVAGALAAETRGKTGTRYLLTGNILSIPQMAQLVTEATGRPAPRVVTPMWLALATAPFAELWASVLGSPPLYTRASLEILRSNCDFSRANSERDLGYTARPALETIRDALAWFREAGMIRKPALLQAA